MNVFSKEHPVDIPWTPVEARHLIEELSLLNDAFFQRLVKMARQLGEVRDQMQKPDTTPQGRAEENTILLVEGDGWLTSALFSRPLPTCKLRSVVSGGIALDAASSQSYQVILINEQLPDVPGHTVARSLLNQGIDSLVVLFRRPAAVPGKVELVEENKTLPVLQEFHDSAQLIAQLPDLCNMYWQRKRDRRHLLAFREENHDLFRRYREVRQKLSRTSTHP